MQLVIGTREDASLLGDVGFSASLSVIEQLQQLQHVTLDFRSPHIREYDLRTPRDEYNTPWQSLDLTGSVQYGVLASLPLKRVAQGTDSRRR